MPRGKPLLGKSADQWRGRECECGNAVRSQFEVIESRCIADSRGVIRRRVQCKLCDRAFTTVELHSDILTAATLSHSAEKIAAIAEELRQMAELLAKDQDG